MRSSALAGQSGPPRVAGAVFLLVASGIPHLRRDRGMRQSMTFAVAGDHMPKYRVRLLDAGGNAHSHTIVAASLDAIIRKAASLYRSRPVVEIWAGDRLVACLTTAEMSAIDSR